VKIKNSRHKFGWGPVRNIWHGTYPYKHSGIALILVLVRTGLEDKTLENELEGYKEYKEKVKYKLIPLIW